MLFALLLSIYSGALLYCYKFIYPEIALCGTDTHAFDFAFAAAHAHSARAGRLEARIPGMLPATEVARSWTRLRAVELADKSQYRSCSSPVFERVWMQLIRQVSVCWSRQTVALAEAGCLS